MGTDYNNRLATLSAIVVFVALACGCITSAPMPSHSFSKFARGPGAGKPSGKLGFSTGTVIQKADDEERRAFYGFTLEGAVTGRMSDNYDLCLSISSGLNLNGNLALVAGDRFRLGFLHGFSVWFWQSKDWGSNLIGLTGGLFFQFITADVGAIFGGFSYILGIADSSSDDLGSEKSHNFNGSLGYMLTVGRLRITLELIHTYRYRPLEDGESPNTRYFFPLITFAAVY